ncbi:MAG TPA: UPF0280 family protein, partial [Acidobacteriaceae bacterium]|nr:UPF0280 family protein [Acidobacteriaceae bacterium]
SRIEGKKKMNSRAQIRMLPDGRRLHLQDGPIDLIVEAFGRPEDVQCAYQAARARFVSLLDELCGELAFLRSACSAESEWPRGSVARRMTAAVMPYAGELFITPMAAVAGAVAEEILAAMIAAAELSRAYVNDGGDIALQIATGEKFVIGMVERPDRPSLFGTTTIRCEDPVRGIATSGWRGRSFSLGIADAVTVLADRAAAADAAATIIANAVNLPGHPAIVRVPACELAPDTDLGGRFVTQSVGPLTAAEIDDALAAGVATAEKLLRIGLIRGAALNLQGETRVVGGAGASSMISTGVEERNLVHA